MIKSPCTRVCRIDSKTQYCEGCKRTLKEMIRRLNILSYNEHDIVESTWFDKDNNIKGIKHKPKPFQWFK